MMLMGMRRGKGLLGTFRGLDDMASALLLSNVGLQVILFVLFVVLGQVMEMSNNFTDVDGCDFFTFITHELAIKE